MAYNYTTVNGKRVEKNVAAAFQKMRAAFKAETGLDLLVSDGTRTRAEQQKLWDDYQAGRGPRAAHPDDPKAYHVESGPTGPRALDIRDSGADAGVTRYGNRRSAWIRDNAGRFGFDPAGYNHYNEPWHIEYRGALDTGGGTKPPAGGGGNTAKGGKLAGTRWYGIQKMLRSDFGYRGGIDNIPGGGSISAFQRFLNAKGYAQRAGVGRLAEDGIDGVNTAKAAQQWLKERWGYTGAIDGIFGGGSKAAWQRAETANWNAYR